MSSSKLTPVNLQVEREKLRNLCGLDGFAQPVEVWLNMAVEAEARGHKTMQADYERAAEISQARWGAQS